MDVSVWYECNTISVSQTHMTHLNTSWDSFDSTYLHHMSKIEDIWVAHTVEIGVDSCHRCSRTRESEFAPTAAESPSTPKTSPYVRSHWIDDATINQSSRRTISGYISSDVSSLRKPFQWWRSISSLTAKNIHARLLRSPNPTPK